MKNAAVLHALHQDLEDCLLANGFDDALIGYVEAAGKTVALYDAKKCVRILMERDGMSHLEAVEFFEFNVLGAFMGENTPAYATILRRVK